MNCQTADCANTAAPGTERCLGHSTCYLCGKSLANEISHAAVAWAARPVEYACNGCYLSLMAKGGKPEAASLRCEGCGAEFGAGCECVENKRAIGRGERREP